MVVGFFPLWRLASASSNQLVALEQPDGAFAPKPGHEHLRSCGLAAAANHAEAATANAKLDRSPADGALRAHFAPGEHACEEHVSWSLRNASLQQIIGNGQCLVPAPDARDS